MQTVHTSTLIGVDAAPVTVEVDTLRRLPAVQVIGLPVGSAKEAAERVRSAVISSGFEWPRQRVIVNLAPADLRKDGTAFDLPIALGVLAASGQCEIPDGWLFLGELGLDGNVRTARGALAAYEMAKQQGVKAIVLPVSDARRVASMAVSDPNEKSLSAPFVFGASSLAQVVAQLRGTDAMEHCQKGKPTAPAEPRGFLDFAEVHGQVLAKRALEVAAAGGHSILMVGPPGCGKTMLAARLPGIMPGMTEQEALDVARIHDAAGLTDPDARGLPERRPFRAPHHSISAAGMLGSALLRPGEATLAHNGVLFLDELPEFQRNVLDFADQANKDKQITVSRACGTVKFPSDFQLVAAANPCPCGFRGHPRRPCGCSDEAVRRYHDRQSMRFDMEIELMPVHTDDLVSKRTEESSATIRARVEAARAFRQARVDQGAREYLTADAKSLLMRITERYARSAAWVGRTTCIARTIADLDGETQVSAPHVAEACQYTLGANGPA